MVPSSTRLILTQNHEIIREGVRSVISRDPALQIVGEVSNSESLLKLLADGIETDVVLIDLHQPGDDPLELIIALKEHYPAVKIVLLSDEDSEESAIKAAKSGASGYLLRSVGGEELIFAIKHICNSSSYVSSKVVKNIVGRLMNSPDRMPRVNATINFTTRELEILTLVSQGFTNDQVAERLFTSRRTIENYRQGLIDKTGSKNIIALVRFAILNGLIN